MLPLFHKSVLQNRKTRSDQLRPADFCLSVAAALLLSAGRAGLPTNEK